MSRFRITKNQRRLTFGSATVYNIVLRASGSIVVSVRNHDVAEFIVKSLDEVNKRTEAEVSAAEHRRVRKLEEARAN